MQWLYRVGLHWTDSLRHRYFVTQTVLSEQPETTMNDAIQGLNFFFEQMRTPFGGDGAARYDNCYPRYQRFFPPPGWTSGINMQLAPTDRYDLAHAAPEAAFRLQRVGAEGARTIGRMCYPILADEWFIDRPHRRRVDADYWNGLLADGLNSREQQYTYNGRTYTNVIFSRKDMTCEPVVAFRVLPSVLRIWQRNRTYDWRKHTDPDVAFIPRQGTFL